MEASRPTVLRIMSSTTSGHQLSLTRHCSAEPPQNLTSVHQLEFEDRICFFHHEGLLVVVHDSLESLHCRKETEDPLCTRPDLKGAHRTEMMSLTCEETDPEVITAVEPPPCRMNTGRASGSSCFIFSIFSLSSPCSTRRYRGMAAHRC